MARGFYWRQLYCQFDAHGGWKSDSQGWVEWITAMTYQAASGAGANNMRELLSQMGYLESQVATKLATPSSAILDIDRQVTEALRGDGIPTPEFWISAGRKSFTLD